MLPVRANGRPWCVLPAGDLVSRRFTWLGWSFVILCVVPSNENVTALLYRRRAAPKDATDVGPVRGREMAFDPLLVFTAVLVSGAVVSQLVFLLALEF